MTIRYRLAFLLSRGVHTAPVSCPWFFSDVLPSAGWKLPLLASRGPRVVDTIWDATPTCVTSFAGGDHACSPTSSGFPTHTRSMAEIANMAACALQWVVLLRSRFDHPPCSRLGLASKDMARFYTSTACGESLAKPSDEHWERGRRIWRQWPQPSNANGVCAV